MRFRSRKKTNLQVKCISEANRFNKRTEMYNKSISYTPSAETQFKNVSYGPNSYDVDEKTLGRKTDISEIEMQIGSGSKSESESEIERERLNSQNL